MHPLFKRSSDLHTTCSIRLDEEGDFSNISELQDRILAIFQHTGAQVLWGGYGEKRSFYQSSPLFKRENTNRNIHAGIDYWVAAGKEVHLPADGRLLSAKDNEGFLNYGPTLIFELASPVKNASYLLIGHLDRASLTQSTVLQEYAAGTCIGRVGIHDENGHWPPHIHVQLIRDLQGFEADFPGLCQESEWKDFMKNCPEPDFPILN
jgi:hypothetical protein